jgi:eukaryotic-like serine/threonine-protein kinase
MESTETGRLLSGRYRLDAVIGRGGMGVVWRARDELLGRDVAVKELVWPAHFTEEEQQTACQRAVREAQIAGSLAHPNVVRVYDILQEDDGHPWIIMELIPHPSLRDVIQEEGPLSPVRAAEVGLGVLGALRAAHAEGVLHRDVKPANIIVEPDGRVVLTDFGIARATDSVTLTRTGDIVGSPSYVAPERARGGESAPAGDLWGLGASLYAAVEGHPPFERDDPIATLTAVVIDEPAPPVHAGPLWPVIAGLMRKEPDHRLGAAETERMLREVADEPAVREPTAKRVYRRLRLRPVLAADEPVVQELAADELAVPEPVVQEPAAQEPSVPEPASDEPAVREPAAKRVHRGPRLRRRPALVLAGLAGAVIVAAAVVVPLTLTSSPGGRSPSPGAGSRPTSHPAPSARASSPSASTPTAPASGSGSSPGGGAGYGALPAGYYRYTDATGFSIGVPDGWRISHSGHYVYVNDPSDSNVFLLIDQSDTPKPNPLADWQQQAANRAGTYPDYHLVRLAAVNYPQAEKAADWEFTYDRSGIPVHILNRNVLANAHQAYALYWSTPASAWTADYRYFQAFASTFRPKP